MPEAMTSEAPKSLRKKHEEVEPRHKVKRQKTKIEKFLQDPIVILVIVILVIVALVFGVIALSNWLSGR